MTLLFNYSLRVVIREDCPEEVTQLRPRGQEGGSWDRERTGAKVLRAGTSWTSWQKVQRWACRGQVSQEKWSMVRL